MWGESWSLSSLTEAASKAAAAAQEAAAGATADVVRSAEAAAEAARTHAHQQAAALQEQAAALHEAASEQAQSFQRQAKALESHVLFPGEELAASAAAPSPRPGGKAVQPSSRRTGAAESQGPRPSDPRTEARLRERLSQAECDLSALRQEVWALREAAASALGESGASELPSSDLAQLLRERGIPSAVGNGGASDASDLALVVELSSVKAQLEDALRRCDAAEARAAEEERQAGKPAHDTGGEVSAALSAARAHVASLSEAQDVERAASAGRLDRVAEAEQRLAEAGEQVAQAQAQAAEAGARAARAEAAAADAARKAAEETRSAVAAEMERLREEVLRLQVERSQLMDERSQLQAEASRLHAEASQLRLTQGDGDEAAGALTRLAEAEAAALRLRVEELSEQLEQGRLEAQHSAAQAAAQAAGMMWAEPRSLKVD
jgi:hypothetical protein